MKITSDQQPGCTFFVFIFPFPVSSYLQRMDGWDIHKFQIKLPEEVNLTRRRVSSNCLSKALFSPVSRTRFSRNSSRSGLSWPTCQKGSLKFFFITMTPQKNTNHKTTNSITHPASCIMLAWMGCWKKLDQNFMKSQTEKRRKKDWTLIKGEEVEDLLILQLHWGAEPGDPLR